MESNNQPSPSFGFMVKSFIAMFLVNVGVVFVANRFFPALVVLGTHQISPMMGLLTSMAVLSLIVTGAMPVIEWAKKEFKLKLKDKDWMIIYWLVNIVGLWVVSRFAETLGLGISSWVVVVVLAFFLDMAQGLVMMKLVTRMK